MISSGRNYHRKATSGTRFALACAALVCAVLLCGPGLAQESRPVADPPAATPAPAPAANQPGFIDAVGRWFEEGTAKLKTGMQSAQEKLDKLGTQARDATKEATGAVVGLPNTRVVTAREHVRCCAQWRTRLQRRGDDAVPRQGLCDRQEPRYADRAEVQFGAVPARGPRAQQLRMSHSDLRHSRDVPVTTR